MRWLHRLRFAAAWLACAVLPLAVAQDVDPGGRERQRIDAERAAAAARYEARLRACEGRFAVTACIDDAKRERRETLLRLKNEQGRLDDARRRARAAERTEAIRQRAAAEAQPAREAAPRETREPREAARRSAPEPRIRPSAEPASSARASPQAREPKARPAPAMPDAATRSRQEARSRATFDAAQRAAEAHRLEVERRNAERAEKHKPAAPLPLPGAASSP